MNLNFQNMGKTQQISGLYLVNEENLNKIGDNDFLKLRKSNALPAIYAHLASLPQADRLAQYPSPTRFLQLVPGIATYWLLVQSYSHPIQAATFSTNLSCD